MSQKLIKVTSSKMNGKKMHAMIKRELSTWAECYCTKSNIGVQTNKRSEQLKK